MPSAVLSILATRILQSSYFIKKHNTRQDENASIPKGYSLTFAFHIVNAKIAERIAETIQNQMTAEKL